MSIFPLLDSRYIERLSLCAFIHRELAKAEISALNGVGEKILNDEDTIYLRENLKIILSHFHQNGLIMKNVLIMAKKSKRTKENLVLIQKSIDKIIDNNKSSFQVQEDTTMHWIPSLFALTILKKLDSFGFRYYPNEIDIDKCLELIQGCNKCSFKEKMAYWKIAREVLINLKYLEK